MLNNRWAIYPGTFDPMTRGHEDLVRRAAPLFEKLLVGIAESPGKRPLFTLNERIEIAREVLCDIPNIEIVGFDTLLIHFVRECGAKVILRGLRAASDFEYEFQMAGMNRSLYPDIETVFMTPSDQFMFVSATMIREIARFGGDVSKFVHPSVVQHLMGKNLDP